MLRPSAARSLTAAISTGRRRRKFPELSEPDESYHGVVYTRDFGRTAYITKARVQLMRDMGPVLSPNSAFMF